MNIKDAAKVLGISGNLTKKDIKKAYRLACSKYHPDKGGSLVMMQAVNAAYEVLKDYDGAIDITASAANYGAELSEAINKIIHLPDIKIGVYGAWVWVTGNTKQYSKILGRKEGGAGFYYASQKKAWYFRPAEWKSASRGKYSLDQIKAKYGSQAVDRRENEKVT